jgi:hypothetical protein
MLIGISSPYRKAGLLYERHRKCFAQNDDRTLVIQASTMQLNPAFDPQVVADALADDPAAARAEYLGEFRDDIGSYVPIELIEGLVDIGVSVRPPNDSTEYVAFVDVASGTGQDSFALAIAHIGEGDNIIVDLTHEIRPPFSSDQAIFDVVNIARSYNVPKVVGDMYGAGLTVSAFARFNMAYEFVEQDRSQLYVEVLPLLTAGRVRLPDNRKLVVQFTGLERHTSSGGKDRIDHGRNSRDDLCNAAAGAIVTAAARLDNGAAAWARISNNNGYQKFTRMLWPHRPDLWIN